eukprot:TRINITY_DN29_c0_g1_i1.p1 TRINITY_DN29_c0_g1~~TRINITY_DN29_c0_g1_i1.p1  ORF type:complete len:199 (+),score=38.93 TRINITY_DN29_c0_g1_i1:78-674(+)
MTNSKYYAVRKGRRPGVYRSWEETKLQVEGFPGNEYKSFGTYEDAWKWFQEGQANVSEPAGGDNTKHIMLSYPRQSESLAIKVYDLLKSAGFNVWMDIKGGIKDDLNTSLAQGVEGAYLVLVFMSQNYQDSNFCCQELAYATDRNVNVIPIKAQGHPWKPEGRLGFLTSGKFWIEVLNEQDLESKKDELLRRISSHSP